MNRDFTSMLDDPLYVSFFEAWKSLRKGGGIPHRSDVKLQNYAQFAADLAIYELKSPTDLRSRLIGSHVSDRVKTHGAGLNWLDLVNAPMRAAGETWWNALFKTPCAGIMQFSTGFLNGTNRLGRSMLLPVVQANEEILLIALMQATAVYRVDEPRDQLVISHDCFQTQFVDIGFGLPQSLPPRTDSLPMDEAVLVSLFEG